MFRQSLRTISPRIQRASTALMLAIILPLSSIVHAGLFDDDEARKQIKQLGEKVEAQNKANDERFNKLDDSIKNIGVIQLLNQIELLNSEIAKLRGQIEVLSNQNDQLQKRQKDFYLDIDTRLRQLEGGGAPPPNPAVTGSLNSPLPTTAPSTPPAGGIATGAVPTAPVGTTVPTTVTTGNVLTIPPRVGVTDAQLRDREDKAYDVGTAAFRRGDFVAAIRGFQTFLNDFPQSQLASNALYWAGLSQFNLKDFAQARSTQELLLKRYPDSPKAPDAMLTIASIQAETGDNGSARNTYEDIIAKYPTSDAAAKARTRLAGIRR
jgi:tol-pal system protein YbgF